MTPDPCPMLTRHGARTARRRSICPAAALLALALASAPSAARADQCYGPESHVSPAGVVYEVTVEPPPVVGPACPITLYDADDDDTGGLGIDPDALEWRLDGQPVAFSVQQAPDRVRQQPYGCWEYEAPSDLGPDEVIERRWRVWVVTPDAPVPEGLAELLQGDRTLTRFTVAADAEGCAESEPPRLTVCSPGVDACNDEPPEPDVGPDGDVLEDDGPGPDAGPDAGDDPDDDGCAAFGAEPPWWPMGLWLVAMASRRRQRSRRGPGGGHPAPGSSPPRPQRPRRTEAET